MPTATTASSAHALPDSFLAWFFVLVWGSGFLATKLGLHYAAPFTFLTLRFSFGLACLIAWNLAARPPLPASAREFAHIAVAGLLMHAAFGVQILRARESEMHFSIGWMRLRFLVLPSDGSGSLPTYEGPRPKIRAHTQGAFK